MTDAERIRLQEAHEGTQPWYYWGPYLSERQWGTVREDYSSDGNAWNFFPHEHARSRTYRWGEDGLMGISDENGLLCFALALWNEADPILKERLFGLTNSEGNHGEDVKEYYFFLDNTPTHSYMKALYKYPQRAYPYNDLLETNRRRGKFEPEYELIDTCVFAEDRYFDVMTEYAKVDPLYVLIRISITNHGPEAAPIHVLPTLWFRNTWAWGYDDRRPQLTAVKPAPGKAAQDDVRLVHIQHHELGEAWLVCEGAPTLLFTENDTNFERLWGVPNHTTYVKDGINDTIVNKAEGKVNPEQFGTKAAAHYYLAIEPGATQTIYLRLSATQQSQPFADAENTFSTRIAEADEFYRTISTAKTDDERMVQRQALAGLLWSKQFFYYDVDVWLRGDPAGPTPPPQRSRNKDWRHLSNFDIVIMPDTWEYPWYAAWDLAFHCIAMALVDSEFAKQQLLLMLHERYLHPNGQLPAYEWAFSDVNPPVHAWVAWRIYMQEKELTGKADTPFLERIFQKLMLNFTWWVNRKDALNNNIFEGGFLGLDNIGVFDRNTPLPEGAVLEQSDGTSWMAMFAAIMLAMSLELAQTNPIYEDMASKLSEHYIYIVDAMYGGGYTELGLWNEEDGFFYDKIIAPDGRQLALKVRSLVGLLPLLAMETFPTERAASFLDKHMRWFAANRPYMKRMIARWEDARVAEALKEIVLLAILRGSDLRSVLKYMLDPQEFLSDYGIRGISKYHEAHPYVLQTAKYGTYTINYQPGESTTGDFGGNSNWRGPIWFPINFLLVEALYKYHRFYGDDFLVEDPTGSGEKLTLGQVADELSRRLTSIFLRDEQGQRPVFGTNMTFQNDPNWRDYIPFHEYFHGDTGRGVGASHQTGWTAVVANLLQQIK
jgi:Mannosylglycerate hydrolase MGH1-like glycoside hydrolase domain/Glycosyl hydrolase family 63 C-terminal domain